MDARSLKVGLPLPDVVVPVTRKMIIMGATASRDWQPQHHDPEHARNAGLPDIIMNNYTQAGLISRYVTDWSGPEGRIGRLRFAMRRPICPAADVHFSGMIVDVASHGYPLCWVEVDIELKCQDRVVTTATARLALPREPGAPSPWRCSPADWKP